MAATKPFKEEHPLGKLNEIRKDWYWRSCSYRWCKVFHRRDCVFNFLMFLERSMLNSKEDSIIGSSVVQKMESKFPFFKNDVVGKKNLSASLQLHRFNMNE